MNVLVIAAHPDDETLGCGGAIKKFSDSGADVRVITLTDGGSARGEKNDRRHQLEKASLALGFTVAEAMTFPDNMLDSVPLLNINKTIESYLEKSSFAPHVIMAHNPWCLNVDHKRAFESAQVIGRNFRCKFMCFEVPSSSEWSMTSDFRPNSYVSLTHEQAEAKLSALRNCYGSEMRTYPHPRSPENLVNAMRVNGSVVGVEYAERFMMLKEVI